MMFFLNKEGKFAKKKVISLKQIGGKDGCKGRLKAVTISDISYLFGQGKCIFIREKSGNFEK
jgi:hypothetical protein